MEGCEATEDGSFTKTTICILLQKESRGMWYVIWMHRSLQKIWNIFSLTGEAVLYSMMKADKSDILKLRKSL